MRTLDAWCEALIPADDLPGASWARVPRFIDIQLTRKYRKFLPQYRQALAAMDRWARQPEAPDITRRLEMMEKGEAPRGIFPDGGKAAFEMVLAHTQQGFYGSPRHGGNRDYVSWTMLGVPPMPVRGREHYEIEPAGGRS
ncbi:MAG: gluconate 2-dehydrogenase subunit 3 family protein [Bryobacteraceae bacterium]|nr:gluconate 2-dehydrogenase subunit 3 family protein [Bryobacteraceae bacterium]